MKVKEEIQIAAVNNTLHVPAESLASACVLRGICSAGSRAEDPAETKTLLVEPHDKSVALYF